MGSEDTARAGSVSGGTVIPSPEIVTPHFWNCYPQLWNDYPLELLCPVLELLSSGIVIPSSGVVIPSSRIVILWNYPQPAAPGGNSCLETAKAYPTHLHLGTPQLIPVNLALLWAEGTELGKVWIPQTFTVLGLSLPSVKQEQHPEEFLGLEVSLRARPTPRCPQTPGGAQGGAMALGHPQEPHLAGSPDVHPWGALWDQDPQCSSGRKDLEQGISIPFLPRIRHVPGMLWDAEFILRFSSILCLVSPWKPG